MRGAVIGRAPMALVPLAVTWVAAAGARWGFAATTWVTVAVVVAIGILGVPRGALHGARGWFGALVAWAALDAALRPVAVADAAPLVAAGAVALGLLAVTSSPRGAAWGRAAAVAAGGVAAGWLIVERVFHAGRPAGPLGNPNLAATLALLGVALAPFLRAPLAARAALAAVCAGGVVASGSRAALVGAAAIAAAWALARRGRRWMWTATLALVGVALVGLAARLASDRDPLRYGRLRIWGVALRTVAAELPLGCGPGGYADAALAHNFPRDGEFARFARLPDVAECDVLQLAATLGVPGLALAAAAAWSAARRMAPGDARGWGVLAAVAVPSIVTSQLMVPVVGWAAALAVGGVMPRPRPWRGVVRGGAFAATTVALALAAGAVLASSDWGAGTAPAVLAQRAEAGLRAHPADEAALAEAETAAWQACAERPRFGLAWRTLGGVRLRRASLRADAGLASSAAAAFAHARRVNPLDAFAALGEGQALRASGDAAGAWRAVNAALALEPNFVSAWLERTILHLSRGELGAARDALARAGAASRRASPATFVTDYERALAWADPVTVARLRSATGVGR